MARGFTGVGIYDLFANSQRHKTRITSGLNFIVKISIVTLVITKFENIPQEMIWETRKIELAMYLFMVPVITFNRCVQ